MQQAEILQGKTYAYRATGKRDDLDLIKVRILSPGRKGRIRVKYEDGALSGLDEWVRTPQILCPWGQRKAFLRDRQLSEAVDAADAKVWNVVVEGRLIWS